MIAGWVGLNAMFYTALGALHPISESAPYLAIHNDAYATCLVDQLTRDQDPWAYDFPVEKRLTAIHLVAAYNRAQTRCRPFEQRRDRVESRLLGGPNPPDPVLLE